MLKNGAESHLSGAPQKMSEHHFEREKQGCMKDRPATLVYSQMAGKQAEKSNGDARGSRLPWCTVVVGRIDLRIGGVRVAARPG